MVAVATSAAFDTLPNLSTVGYAMRTGEWPANAYDNPVDITAFQTLSSLAEQQPSAGTYERYRCSFRLRLADLAGAGILPDLGDLITDADGETWTVIHGHKGLTSWTVGCIRFVLRGPMIQYVRVSGDSSSTTARTITETIGDPMQCAIQPDVRQIVDEFGTLATPQTYTIWLDAGVGQAIGAGDMFEETGGTRYEILEVTDRRRLDELSTFRCVKKA